MARILTPEQKKRLSITTLLWQKNNREKYNINRERWYFKKFYGITPSQYDEILISQDKKCAICNTDKHYGVNKRRKFVVDHCHKTNKVRGLLCSNCNVMLGMSKDNPDLLLKAVSYISKWSETNNL